MIIKDINDQNNYLSCSIHVKSEIVVPVFLEDGTFVAELDIDSHKENAFDNDDLKFLNKVANLISKLIPKY